MPSFFLIDQYLGTMLDIDVFKLKPMEYIVTESDRRLRCEQSYGFVHALYGIFFDDGRIAVSVIPGASLGVNDLLAQKQPDLWNTFDQDWLDSLTTCVNQARFKIRLPPSRGGYECKLFACNGKIVRRYNQGDCHRLQDQSIPPADGLRLPTHCFPNGIVYGIVEDGHIVSVAYAHKTGRMEDRVADLAVETAEPYRKRGYAKTTVSAVTFHETSSGGEAVYICSSSNKASIATATSVGFEPYGRIIVIAAPDI